MAPATPSDAAAPEILSLERHLVAAGLCPGLCSSDELLR